MKAIGICASLFCAALLVRGVLATGTSTAPATVAPDEPEAASLVKVSLRGTNIGITPDWVDVIVKDPQREARTMAELWGVPRDNDSTIVTYGRVTYCFASVEELDRIRGLKLKVGDVIYTFLMQSNDERMRLLNGSRLRKTEAELGLDEGVKIDVWAANENTYVIVLARTVSFTCAMHPQVESSKAGPCPKCGLELIPRAQYR